MNQQITRLALSIGKSILGSFSLRFFLLFPISATFFFFSPIRSEAQSYRIENVSFTPLERNIVVIDYDLVGNNRRYQVDLELRRKNLPTFRFTPTTLTGDIGKGRFAGQNRKIVWSLDNEEEGSFYIDPYINDYYFEVKVRRRTQAGWFMFLGLAGGVGWFIYQNN